MTDEPTTDGSPELPETRTTENTRLGGTTIGPYKLLQQIGEGGMGSVWMAEQGQPVRRRVALKLIKSGADSKEVIARFEAERQALAMMNHQNIAKAFRVPNHCHSRQNGLANIRFRQTGKTSAGSWPASKSLIGNYSE